MQPQPQNQASPPAAADVLKQSFDAFYRDLPEVLKKHYGQWVAYHGNECIGFARTQTELHQRCLRLGLNEDEFVVLYADRQALYDQEEIELPPNP
jgi:hypothetical protein